jgi:hypothetical protein
VKDDEDRDELQDDTPDEDIQPQPQAEKPLTREELQAEIDRNIRQFTARERGRQEKQLKDMFGTSDLRQISEGYRAGQLVSQRAGLTPANVLSRLATGIPGQPQAVPQPNPGVPDPTRQDVAEIKNLLFGQAQQTRLQLEEVEATKDFGEHFTRNRDQIADVAEERGLSLADAAAIVLRPHLRTIAADRAKADQDVTRRRKVDGTGDAPGAPTGSAKDKLSAKELQVAAGMGISPEDYLKFRRE